MKIASWNVEARLSGWMKKGRGTAKQLLEEIEQLNADVLVLPEAYINTVAPFVPTKIQALGYKILEVEYNDYGREDEKYMRGSMRLWVLSRFPVESVESHRWGDVRNLLSCVVREPSSGKRLRIIAMHLDDRSEAARQKQIAEIIPYVNSSSIPTVMLGDFNAMWRRGRARILHSGIIRFIASIVPGKELRQVATHLTDMASGSILSDITAKTNLQITDKNFQPTITPKRRGMLFMPSVRLAQIDHMLVSPVIKVDSFKVDRDGGSDHRSITATLTIK